MSYLINYTAFSIPFSIGDLHFTCPALSYIKLDKGEYITCPANLSRNDRKIKRKLRDHKYLVAAISDKDFSHSILDTCSDLNIILQNWKIGVVKNSDPIFKSKDYGFITFEGNLRPDTSVAFPQREYSGNIGELYDNLNYSDLPRYYEKFLSLNKFPEATILREGKFGSAIYNFTNDPLPFSYDGGSGDIPPSSGVFIGGKNEITVPAKIERDRVVETKTISKYGTYVAGYGEIDSQYGDLYLIYNGICNNFANMKNQFMGCKKIIIHKDDYIKCSYLEDSLVLSDDIQKSQLSFYLTMFVFLIVAVVLAILVIKTNQYRIYNLLNRS